MVDQRVEKAVPEGRDPQEAPEVDSGSVQKILGDRGLSMWAGYLNEEWYSELKPWTNEAKYVLEARDDAIISMLLAAVKLPIVKAEISVEPASDDYADLVAADWLEANLDQMHRQSKRKWINDTLESIEFGFSIGEIVLEKRSDGRMWLRNIEPRGQETLRRWGLEDQQHPDIVTHFVQRGFRGGTPRQEVAIPLDKCLHITLQARKGSPQGKSFLRSLYIPYKYLKNYRAFEGIGIERDIGGTPILKLPEGIGTIDSAEFTELKKQMEGLRNDQALYVTLPEGFELDSFSGSKQLNIRDVIKDYEKLILMRLFAQFLQLGMDNVGTQALVEGSHDFFALGLEAIQDEIMEQVNDQLVPYLFRFNSFPGTTGLPKVVWSKPGKMDIENVVKWFENGARSKIFTPTRDDEQRLRDEMGLEQLPDGVGEEPRDVPGQVNDIFGGLNGMGLRSTLRGMVAEEVRHYDHPAGQDLRVTGGIYERFTNEYQRDLVAAYDKWAAETSRLMNLPGKTLGEAELTLNRRLPVLEADLKSLARTRVGEATNLGLGEALGKRVAHPEVQTTVSRILKETDDDIATKIIPGVRERFSQTSPLMRDMAPDARKSMIDDLFAGRRSRIAQSAGQAQVAIFETQRVAGKVENQERRRLGQPLIKVRWVLDDRAHHCESDNSRATFGCPDLAREYSDGWESMPTVPAGNVSCLGNCRCFIEADFGDGWKRIT